MKISDILWKAANEHLCSGWVSFNTGELYSCIAVELAAGGKQVADAHRFLASMGVDVQGYGQFSEFAAGSERQGARYLWLMFAYEVAKSEGL
jgi:hypothetical protein